ncbi:MAG: hypothetical protein SGI84_10535 [Gemmatimonadota bacterium]|nr:hypothetical protein [Gemmatimonadota bacterium]
MNAPEATLEGGARNRPAHKDTIMRTLSFRLMGVVALLATAAGCSDTPTNPSEESVELAVAFEEMAATANREGDAEGAASLSAGSIALRMGARPTDIEVVIDGESIRHHALVAAVSRTVDGQTRLLQTLFAWTGARRPTTVLEVGILGEEGTFDPTATADPSGRARGVYRNLVDRFRWIAASGTAAIGVIGTGEACGRPLSENPNISCVKARFNVHVDGLFRERVLGSDQPASDVAHRIFTEAEGVNGVVVGPAGT